jgi:drug/metabolite transporter (DMT)-like permease
MWILLAVLASMFWGINYMIGEQIYKNVSVTTYLGIICLVAAVIMFILSYTVGGLKDDVIAILSSKKLELLVFFGAVTFIAAELLIGFSIQAKNATFAGLLEISYPIFIAIFSLLFLKETQISISAIIGGFFIFAGITVISVFNK